MKKKDVGFTLLEMLLVLAIMSTVLMMLIGYATQRFDQFRRDKAVMQMQQILNAGLSYYINNGKWPLAADATCNTTEAITPTAANFLVLRNGSYLPPAMQNNPWGNPYQVGCSTVTGVFQVSSEGLNNATAQSVAGSLPLGFVDATNNKLIRAGVNIPGQNLNNARSMNFAGVYRHGACVPVPKCPLDMTPQLFLTPMAVDSRDASDIQYPIQSFLTYYTGGNVTSDLVPQCKDRATASPCLSDQSEQSGVGTPLPKVVGDNYWRACMQVITSQGDLSNVNQGTGTNAWGKQVAMGAFTRCQPKNENIGSKFTVFTQ